MSATKNELRLFGKNNKVLRIDDTIIEIHNGRGTIGGLDITPYLITLLSDTSRRYDVMKAAAKNNAKKK